MRVFVAFTPEKMNYLRSNLFNGFKVSKRFVSPISS